MSAKPQLTNESLCAQETETESVQHNTHSVLCEDQRWVMCHN